MDSKSTWQFLAMLLVLQFRYHALARLAHLFTSVVLSLASSHSPLKTDASEVALILSNAKCTSLLKTKIQTH